MPVRTKKPASKANFKRPASKAKGGKVGGKKEASLEASSKQAEKSKTWGNLQAGLASKIGPPETSKAFLSLQAVASGSKDRKDVQNCSNFLKSLASSGNPAPLEAYQNKHTHLEKREFLKALSLDPKGPFPFV